MTATDPSSSGGDPDPPGAVFTDDHERLEKVRQRVMNVVGHELRTPVSTLRGLAEAAASADAEILHDEILPALLRNARRMEGLVDDLLTASGVTTAVPVDPPEPVALGDLAREVAAELAGERGPTREVDVRGEATALVPRPSARTVLHRVLHNAARYSTSRPTLELAADDRQVRLTLDAPGPDPHPEEIALATEAFYRGEHAVMTGHGLGLGLAVAAALAEHAGGALRVEAREGGGLRTIVVLPAA